jgi:IclR family acetate operon transcriptional repressor
VYERTFGSRLRRQRCVELRSPHRTAAADEDVIRIIQSVDRAISLLEAISESGRDGVALSTLARRVGLIPSTAYRILDTLVRRGCAIKDETSRRYFPGPALRVGRTDNELALLRRKARRHLRDLARTSGETANLAIIGRGGLTFVDQIVSAQLVRVVPQSGGPLPIHATASGKALLAAMPPSRVAQYTAKGALVRFTQRTIVTRDALIAHLEKVRRAGYATDDEEMAPGGRCVAAVVQNDGRALAALSVSGPTVRMTRRRLRALGDLVRQAARALSAEMAGP